MRAGPVFAALGCLVLPLSDAIAWWDESHMQVAAVAYYRLTPETHAKADAPIELNPHYESWIAGWPSGQVAEYASVRAAIWADDIKSAGLGYTDVGDKPTASDAGRNIGYQEFLRPETKLPDPDPTLASVAVPEVWLQESKKLAEDFVYAEPVQSAERPYMLDRQYKTNSKRIARQQAALAGARLAKLINEALK